MMRFYQKIILAAFVVTLVAGGARWLPGGTAPVTEPGWWAAQGAALIGVEENGWCACI